MLGLGFGLLFFFSPLSLFSTYHSPAEGSRLLIQSPGESQVKCCRAMGKEKGRSF